MDKEQEAGFTVGLQESRGRKYRHLRKWKRQHDPEVQAKREASVSGAERPETKPMLVKAGSQRWRRMKELEEENMKKQEELLEEKQKMAKAWEEKSARTKKKLEEHLCDAGNADENKQRPAWKNAKEKTKALLSSLHKVD